MKRTRTSCSEQGFTMVVIAALFIAFSVVAAVAVERNTTVQGITRRNDAAAQLSRLSMAIIEYGVFNATGTTLLYPCPAPMNVATSSASFGTSVPNCWSVASDTMSGITYLGSAAVADQPISGMVPVQTLSPYGIGFTDAFDPWGNRIVYVVNRRLTLASTSSASANLNNVTMTDAALGSTIPAPDFVLVSLGRDGIGAIKRDSTTVGIACGATALLRYENCNSDAVFKTAPANTGVNATSATYFDDLVSYYRQ